MKIDLTKCRIGTKVVSRDKKIGSISYFIKNVPYPCEVTFDDGTHTFTKTGKYAKGEKHLRDIVEVQPKTTTIENTTETEPTLKFTLSPINHPSEQITIYANDIQEARKLALSELGWIVNPSAQ